jgi:hypothetical protein
MMSLVLFSPVVIHGVGMYFAHSLLRRPCEDLGVVYLSWEVECDPQWPWLTRIIPQLLSLSKPSILKRNAVYTIPPRSLSSLFLQLSTNCPFVLLMAELHLWDSLQRKYPRLDLGSGLRVSPSLSPSPLFLLLSKEFLIRAALAMMNVSLLPLTGGPGMKSNSNS